MTFHSIVSIATLWVSLRMTTVQVEMLMFLCTSTVRVRHAHITEEIKKTISSKQVEVTTVIDAIDQRQAEVAKQLEKLKVYNDTQEEVEATESRIDILRQIEDDHTALRALLKILDELLAKAQEEAVIKAATENENRSTAITFGDENSGLQIGISNGPISGISFGAN